ncbi:MAG: Tat pathway signal protein, partial [Candidatus Electrothrix sp. AUS1_2]|nr:Tat pathway signal protein [Candidatus Electrothrix sp. AUS1_2]
FARTGSCAFAAPARTSFQPVRFAVFSDLHVDIHGKNDIKMGAVSVECLQRTVADINREEHLDFVLVPGDLLLDGELENARVVRDLLNKITVPCYIVAGNHDYRPANPEFFREGFHYLGIEEFVELFKGHGYVNDRRYYAHSLVPGLRLIGLDTCLPGEDKWGGVLPDEQLAWLDKELTEHHDSLHLIMMHHNVIRWSADETVGGPKQFFCIDNDVTVKKLLAKHSRTAPIVFSGHRHVGLRHKEVDGVNYFVVPSLNSHPMRYAVFTLTPQEIFWKTPMVSVAEPVHLEAREHLLNNPWWRGEERKERTPDNDAAVLDFYENNMSIFGSVKV